MLLGGDLGGTKTLLALADADGHIVRQRRYASADYPDFADLLADFLSGDSDIAAACFGIAGPTDGQTAQLTYLPWQLSAADLGRRYGIARVALINDFAAAAHGLSHVAPEHLIALQTGSPDAAAPRLVLGAGTGLGVAGLLPENGGFRVVPGEGGHLGFAPQTPEQGELWRWLLAQHGRATTEDIVSGPGLARVYAFLGGPPATPEAIGNAACRGGDARAHAALQLWLACLGAFAGDLALHWLARGGVYLAGGIAARLLPQVDCAPLLAAFHAKREHAELMPAMPLYLVTDAEIGLRGALALAAANCR
ncbi:glucokinase [Azonexus sp.]|jgi:glucokinase|uniref:glucokinase n=1 Tax=Azonexus sp. TaxID=1872668 RepID=UPI002833BCAF|nr:glucokinase [Azonexus sp.]MDR1995987.1 glucokinase [Azonexus sp.]